MKNTNLTASRNAATNVDAELTNAISIVVPCFNEELSIPNLFEHLTAAKRELEWYEVEFIFVDDGSEDSTYELLHDHFGGWQNCRILKHETNQGLMGAVMTGTIVATHGIICTIDSDCTYDPCRLVDLLPELVDGVAMVTGSPYHPDGAVQNVPGWRLWISYSASWIYRRLLKSQIYCYTSSFRVYRRSAIEEIALENTGFVGTTELLWKLELDGWKIAEVPAVLAVRQFGQSKMRVVQVAMSHLKMMTEIALSRLWGKSRTSQNQSVSKNTIRSTS